MVPAITVPGNRSALFSFKVRTHKITTGSSSLFLLLIGQNPRDKFYAVGNPRDGVSLKANSGY